MKRILFISIFLILQSFSTAHAMHIMEGFLPLHWAVFYFALCIPIIILGVRKITKLIKADNEVKLMLALCGAYIFLLSALKLPSITGSSSHPTGVGLSAILFGPLVSSVLSMIVLFFQAVFLAHGGITTLGANTFSMGIVGPFAAYFTFKLLKQKNLKMAVFVSAMIGDLLTYVTTALQLSIAFPGKAGGILESFIKFSAIFAITQIPLAIIEGLVTVIIYDYIQRYFSNGIELGGEKI
ncbi:Cobalt transport protein CbiM precursor [Caloramator mitchellensis]|uniref:Cobalt transport protein CbiM n=1 Tax=Caloramator mitchellensis TaxID=908809 RepID=A0A0R3JR74_CALMK|nr:energy-coupling factor ABC transporter permease [Caloramator mitchellensis]KRQ85928.1 Cobalt transport protein CbiM precursor [Caloramator mitchellensis]